MRRISIAPVLEGTAFSGSSIAYHGSAIDSRGAAAVSRLSETCELCEVQYNVDSMSLTLGKNQTSIGADSADTHLCQLPVDNVVLETTTLGFAELFVLVRGLLDGGRRRLYANYTEPGDYVSDEPNSLSEQIVGYRAIPNATLDLESNDVTTGVFFVGYEADRIEQAFEQIQTLSSKRVTVVFGVPSYQVGWELKSFLPHLKFLGEHQGHVEIDYCSANNPSLVMEYLSTKLSSIGPNEQMFVAPIGTKPSGLAVALFQSANPTRVSLLYDHPVRKLKRSEGVGRSQLFEILMTEEELESSTDSRLE
jgi:hypothetical protein